MSSELSKGGIWADDTIPIEGQWEGDATSASQSSAPKLGRNPPSSDAARTIKAAQISQETVAGIARIVGDMTFKRLGLGPSETLRSVLDKHKTESEKDIRKWIADVSERMQQNTPTHELGMKVSLIDEKVAELQTAISERKGEERELIARALEVIERSRREEEASESWTSDVQRLEERKTTLEAEVAALQAARESATPQATNLVAKGKKKSGFSSTVF